MRLCRALYSYSAYILSRLTVLLRDSAEVRAESCRSLVPRRALHSALVTILLIPVAPWNTSRATAQPWDGPRIFTAYADAVVYIEARATRRDGGTEKWTGTGFIVHEKGFV